MERKFEISYLSIALSDLEEIIAYIRVDSPKAAFKMVEKINEIISRLQYFPESGTVPRDKRLKKLGYRIIVVDNYLVFYTFKDNIVEIRRVLHGMRNYKFLL